ncbi:putative ATPase [Magnetospirillum sp. LM-5]|uniref:AAA family ATPase n=1 Tax=Magnetospirillum sp. LM-5 TaxID=2681466 RepID=UPI00137C639C|nr:AAA family ATPase [Magnetospirillum sp. LM-5]CAA7625539.1 putative ATPase [Magnetospirillum sp. LM-5]
MLTGLHIQNYRQFRDFKVEGLKRFNLIVGDNGVGKSALLEAVWLLVNDGDVEALLDILKHRGEHSPEKWRSAQSRDWMTSPLASFAGTLDEQSAIAECWLTALQGSANGSTLDITVDFSQFSEGRIAYKAIRDNHKMMGRRLPAAITDRSRGRFKERRDGGIFLLPSGLADDLAIELWYEVALTDKEAVLEEMLRQFSPGIERVSLGRAGEPIVKLKDSPSPVPLGRLGEGASRLFGLGIAALSAQGGVFLVDEIESGLYRDRMSDVWLFLAHWAHQLDFQVFATTHSWDCIAGFAEASTMANERELFRLERDVAGMRVVRYGEELLATAARNGIEVR